MLNAVTGFTSLAKDRQIFGQGWRSEMAMCVAHGRALKRLRTLPEAYGFIEK